MLSRIFMKAVLMGGVGVTALNKGLARRWWVGALWWDYLHSSGGGAQVPLEIQIP